MKSPKPTQTVKKVKAWVLVRIPEMLTKKGVLNVKATIFFSRADARFFAYQRDIIYPTILNLTPTIKDKQ